MLCKISGFYCGDYEECRLLGCCVALVRTDVSEERIAYYTISSSVIRLLVTANVVPSAPVLVTLMIMAIRSSATSIPVLRHRVHNSPADPDECSPMFGAFALSRRDTGVRFCSADGGTLQPSGLKPCCCCY
jgi:hypothetical protein